MEHVLLRAPMHINWNYTYMCDFNCIHCYSRTRTGLKELPLEDKKAIANNIIKNRVFNVNLGGGEPLLSEDVFEIIHLLSSNNVYVNLSTNGYKTSADTVKRLKEAGLGGIAVSLDHIEDEVHDSGRNKAGSLSEAYESIKKYVAEGIKVTVSTTITSRNFDVLEEIIKKSVELGVSAMDFKRLKTTGNAADNQDALVLTDQQRDELYESIPVWKKKYPLSINFVYGEKRIPDVDAGCPCGKTSLAIMCNGDISPCVYNVIRIGNAIKDDLHDIWCKSPELIHLRNNFNCLGLMKEEDYDV